jgi:tetratricopeptide (TPR) repeat protein
MIFFPSLNVLAFQESQADSATTSTIIDLAYNCQFNEALRFSDSLATREPASIKWEFFRAFVLWQELISLDSAGVGDQSVETEFSNSIAQVINAAESRLTQNPSDTSALFYAGFGLGYLAKFDAAKGDKWKAARESNKGLSYHRKLLSICPNWYDVYFSTALFNYYTCVLPWYLKPLLFIVGGGGSRNKAYDLLTLVSTKGTIAKYEAESVLGELYEREGKYDSSSFAYSKLILQFPKAALYYSDRILWAFTDGNQYQMVARKCKEAIKMSAKLQLSHCDSLYLGKIYFRLADAYEKLGDYGNAMDAYSTLINHYGSMRKVSEAHFSIARLYEQANDSPDAIREYQWVVNKSNTPELSKEARERLDNLGVR